MKNVFIVLVLSAFGISTAFAQTPAAIPSKGEVKTAVKASPAAVKADAKKATDATKTAAKAATSTAKTEVKKADDATKTAVKEVPVTAKTDVQKAPAAAKTATTAEKSVKTATAAKATKMKAAPMTKMMYKCPKGDALCDTGGKCPKCGTEMEPISAAKKTATKKK